MYFLVHGRFSNLNTHKYTRLIKKKMYNTIGIKVEMIRFPLSLIYNFFTIQFAGIKY